MADLVRQRLEVIASRHRFPAFKREIRAFFSGYQQLVERIREVVRTALPAEATVIVVSKGDNELLELDGKRAWDFPQNEEGVYAGYHPADSAGAIAHLEELRAKGGEFASLSWYGLLVAGAVRGVRSASRRPLPARLE